MNERVTEKVPQMTEVIEKWMKAVQFNVSEGWTYGWDCFSKDTHALSATSNDWESTLIFDRTTKEVFLCEVLDMKNARSYRYFFTEEHQKAHKAYIERLSRAFKDVDYNDKPWITLDVEEDFFDKLTAIVKGEEYDARVEMPLNLTDEEFLLVAKQAHQLDITINQYIERVLTLAVTELKAHNGDQ